MEYVLTVVIIAMATILVTRLFLIAAGYPQLGGDGLHIAHVLWGGALLLLAVLLLLTFIGPGVRPLAAFVGGIGFGLFIDEVGKFLTDDNDYFYAPAFSVMYASCVAVVVVADVLLRRRQRDPSEDVAAAANLAVAGIAGGFTRAQRAQAEALLARARVIDDERGPGGADGVGGADGADGVMGADSGIVPDGVIGAPEVARLVAVIPDDDVDAPDPISAVRRRVEGWLRRLGQRRDLMRAVFAGSAAVLAGSTVAAVLDLPDAVDNGVAFLAVISLGSIVAAWILWVGALRARQRSRALALVRAAIAVNLLLTQVSLFRFDPWQATVLVVAGLVVVGIAWTQEPASSSVGPGTPGGMRR